MDKSHTILLVQPGCSDTRTYCDYESVSECLQGVCEIFEDHLKKCNPNKPTITFDISQLFDFMDALKDISCLTYKMTTNTYAPYSKDWIKEQMYLQLHRAAIENA